MSQRRRRDYRQAQASAPLGVELRRFIYALDAGHPYVGYEIKSMGFAEVRGRFAGISGAIRYD